LNNDVREDLITEYDDINQIQPFQHKERIISSSPVVPAVGLSSTPSSSSHVIVEDDNEHQTYNISIISEITSEEDNVSNHEHDNNYHDINTNTTNYNTGLNIATVRHALEQHNVGSPQVKDIVKSLEYHISIKSTSMTSSKSKHYLSHR